MVYPTETTTTTNFAVPCTINTYGNAWDGNLTFGVFEYNPANASQIVHSYLVVMKTDGELLNLKEYDDPQGDYGITKYINSDTIMYQGAPGVTTHFWNLDTNQTTDFPEVTGYHHDIDYDPATGDFLTLGHDFRIVNGSNVLYDTINEYNATGAVLWTWDTYDYLPFSWNNPLIPTTTYNGETAIDFTHCNAIQWDFAENVCYLNSRSLDTFWKINMTTGDIIWGCGLHGNFTLLDASGNVVSSLWYGCHDPEEIAPDVFIMFNNDYMNLTNPNDDRSSILEVTLNEQNMTAKETWSWEAPADYYSAFWGKADVLPNGDAIGTFGPPTKPYNSSIGAVLVEVNPQGKVVRTWTFPAGWGIYRVVEQGIVPNSLGIYPEPEIMQVASSGGFDLRPVAIVVTIVAIVALVSILMLRRRKNSGKQTRAQFQDKPARL